ncbi:iron ABC transporter ATP-binding protein [Methylopila jiangsuensis]|uniref:Iron ABC transporter ATP-binding protein n=1 Tax=Methylopila jiangsuensis TaxID=586230 RepID=A0A9W6JE12_9HYPH|nr:ABC transporter ATP-binding protein [Methylopila jiangsuensis]MDR6286098.1 iron(III) transport system ATP-binding protein [Methylopila jiangsuensis]GLK75856.1 iron ABC transporter ATP-binding protein [Methylopila jiangsuensis]
MTLRRNDAPSAEPARALSLAFDGVWLSHGEALAVQDVSFEVPAGGVTALLGESGSGKTTILRVAAGVERPSRGEVRLGGRTVAGPGVFVAPEKRGVGLMFQDFALFPHMTLLRNVAFGLKGLPRKEAEAIARAELRRVGLGAYADRLPGELSGGEQQRAALARAVAPRPGALLMDEPFSGLDRRLRDRVRDDALAILKDVGATAVIVTHDPEEAMLVADEIVLLRRGRVIQRAAPETLYRAPDTLYAARFFSELNELEAEVRDGQALCALGRVPAPALPDGPAIVALRPEGVRIAPTGEGAAGRALSRRFVGGAERVELSVEGLSQPLRARLRPGVAPAPDSDVRVTLDPTESLVFAARET